MDTACFVCRPRNAMPNSMVQATGYRVPEHTGWRVVGTGLCQLYTARFSSVDNLVQLHFSAKIDGFPPCLAKESRTIKPTTIGL